MWCWTEIWVISMDSVLNIYIDRHRNRHRCVKCWEGEGVVCVYMHRYMHFLALPAERGAIRNDISTLMGTSSAQILVSKHHPPIRTRAPFRNDWFQSWGWESKRCTQKYLGPKSKEMLKEWRGCVKRAQEPTWKCSYWQSEYQNT